ncbi:MAG: hypothetical protein QOJ88_1290 [Pyrinomonadaceae bacterium]|nr:hypothetical protein [Pyrinomonadaceae bacterium]
MIRHLVVLFVLPLALMSSFRGAATSPQRAERRSLERSKVVINSPNKSPERESRIDRKTGKEVFYDAKPSVEIRDAKSGTYALKWIGHDGKERVVLWQRGDALDALVTASVSQANSGEYSYTYRVKNLGSSGQNLINFIPQNFASDAKPLAVDGRPTSRQDLRVLKNFRGLPDDGKPRNLESVVIGEMSSDIEQFKEGNWISFGLLPDFQPVGPGRELEVTLASSQPPGLVGCVVRGGNNLKQQPLDEEMPAGLAGTLPGYEQFPRGFTIGPVSDLKKLTAVEYAKYVTDKLPQFEKLGWITPAAREWYQQNLGGGSRDALLQRAAEDLKSEQITSEVFAMIAAGRYR